MGCLTIHRDNYVNATFISNRFIDDYMKDANDAQIKVYLYLLRIMTAHLSTSVSDIADKFNHTEKDVLRALKYWEKQKLITLEYNESKVLTDIHIIDIEECPSSGSIPVPEPIPVAIVRPEALVEQAQADPYEKPSYSADALKTFKQQEEAAQILFITEQYLGRPLTTGDMKSILYIYERLGFSADLIDYLIQYCVDRGKKDFRYIEKVAVTWAEDGITTPKQAASLSKKYDKSVYTIMSALGKSAAPVGKEVDYITKWTKTYSYSLDLILEACSRTVLAVDKHRFEYADGILSNWHKANVHHLSDVSAADEKHKKSAPTADGSKNPFNQFKQNSYDFAALEKEILSN